MMMKDVMEDEEAGDVNQVLVILYAMTSFLVSGIVHEI